MQNKCEQPIQQSSSLAFVAWARLIQLLGRAPLDCDQWDKMARLFYQFFGHLRHSKLAPEHKIFAKMGSTFSQLLNKPSKNLPKLFKLHQTGITFAKSGHTECDALCGG